jgi:hypothetical protein
MQQNRYIHEPRTSFGDSSDYLELAAESIFQPSFWIANRPPVIPLFFKFLGLDPERIFAAQFWISIIAWGILALVVALCVRSYLLKPLGFVVVLAFSLSQNIIMWDPLILSDSLSLSILALFLASCLWLALEWKPYRFLCMALMALLMAFIRDTYAYFLLMSGLALLLALLVSPHFRRIFAVSGLFVVLFLINYAQANAGDRWLMPFFMNMSFRILPNPDYLAYFQAHGMPVNEALMERSAKPGYADNFAFFNDPRLAEFREWTFKHGRSQFIKFLWFYKADTFQIPLKDLDLIFNPDVYYYAPTGFRPIITDTRLSELFYPLRFGILSVMLANFLAALLIFPMFYYRQLLWSVPLILVLFSYPQAVLIWNADANDIPRHALYHNIELRLGLWLMIVFVLDFAMLQISPILEKIRIESKAKSMMK